MKHVAFFIMLISSLLSHLQAIEQFNFRHVNVENGLSDNKINCITQDTYGFIWIGTENGLNKYDGRRIEIFKNDPNNTNSLCGNQIQTLYVSSKGELWIGTNNGGLSRYDYQSNSFINYRANERDNTSITTNFITSICEDSYKNLWIGTLAGLNLYQPETDNFKRFVKWAYSVIDSNAIYKFRENNIPEEVFTKLSSLMFKRFTSPLDFEDSLKNRLNQNEQNKWLSTIINCSKNKDFEPSLLSDNIRIVLSDDNGRIFVAYDNLTGLTLFDHFEGRHVQYSDIFSDVSPQLIENISNLFLSNDQLIIGTSSLFFSRLNLKTNDVEVIHKDRYYYPVKPALYVNEGRIFIGRPDGLIMLDSETKTSQRYVHEITNKHSLSGNHITCLYVDNQNNLWVGTEADGLNVASKLKSFDLYSTEPNSKYILHKPNIGTILQSSDGKLYFGSYETGISVYAENNDPIYHISDHYSGSINSLVEDRSHKIWVGGFNYPLSFLDTKKARIIKVLPDEYGMQYAIRDVRDMVIDEKGFLWVATHGNGILKVNTETLEAADYTANYEKWETTLSNDWTYCIEAYSDTIVLVGTVYGLSVLNPQTGIFRNYWFEPGNISSISNNTVRTIYTDSKNRIWVGTDDGLNLFNHRNGTFMSIGEKDELLSTAIKAILEDDRGNLWVSTGSGISKVSLETDATGSLAISKIINYGNQEGLSNSAFIENSAIETSEGLFLFGGKAGVTAFYPDSIKINTYLPDVYISELKLFNSIVNINDTVNDRVILDKNPMFTDYIELKYNENYFSLSFSAINFIQPNNSMFAYYLEGFDDNWNLTQHKNEVTYTNLPHGTYIFHVKAANNDRVWNEEHASITIKVRPPWWRTKASYVLYILGSVLVVYLVISYFIQREKIKQQNELERIEKAKNLELEKSKLRFFTNISHEFRTPVSLIISPIEKLLEGDQNLPDSTRVSLYELVHNNAKRLLRLINQILDVRKIEMASIKLKYTSTELNAFVEDIVNSFDFQAKQQNLRLQYDKPARDFYLNIDIDRIEKVLYNLLSNAFKHTPENGRITVKIEKLSKEELLERLNVNAQTETESDLDFSNVAFISVIDTGKGVPENQLETIFERFYQVDNKNSVKSGTGIGLSLANDFIKLHHGHIWAENKTGGGARFCFYLPDIEPDEVIIPVESGMEEHKQTGSDSKEVYESILNTQITKPENAYKVLIVEDNYDLRIMLKMELSGKYEVFEAANGKLGLAEAQNIMPDLIISDVMMPAMDGFEFCEHLKSDIETCHIPVILLTALHTEENIVNGISKGADDYISKPFNNNVLLAKVDGMLTNRKRIREKYATTPGFLVAEVANNKLDEDFLQKLSEIVEKNLQHPDLSADYLAEEMAVSRSLLYKKLKSITDQSVNEFITIHKLNKAVELMLKENLAIGEVADVTGFSSQSYFTRCFSKQFNMSPKQFIASKK